MMDSPYTTADIAVIMPTKDRPEKVEGALRSLAAQSARCGRVIVVASGDDIQHVVDRFSDQIPVEYVRAGEPGQLRQRNLGIRMLDDRTRLVAFLDDDVVLAPDAFERLIQFWNQQESSTAAVGLNLAEKDDTKLSAVKKILRRLLPPGRVYSSGFSAPMAEFKESARTQRMRGGSTVWRREILEEFQQEEVNCSWAISEDLIFSYPIGRKYPLYICAEAKALHDHVISASPAGAPHFARGKTWALWQLYFVTHNRDLSLASYAVAVFSLSSAGIVVGTLIPSKSFYRKFYMGLAAGAITGIRTVLAGREVRPLLENG